MWFGATWLLAVTSLPVLSPVSVSEASILGTDLWRPRPKREEVLVPDWILAEGCHVENCPELTGREAPESNRNASHVRIRTPLLLTAPSPGRIRFPGGKEVPISSTELRNHLANMLCCLVNEVTHITDRATRSKLMSSFYENIISWIEELLIPALTTERYVSVEERNAVSRLAKDLGVLQQDRYVPAFYLDVTEAREREEERIHLQTIGMIVACSVGSVLLTFGLLFCVVMARDKKKAVARSQGEMEPLLESSGASPASAANAASTDGDGTATTPEPSLGQTVVSRARMSSALADTGYLSDSGSTHRRAGAEVTVSLEDTCSDEPPQPSTSASPQQSVSVSPRQSGSASPGRSGSVSSQQTGRASPRQSGSASARQSGSTSPRRSGSVSAR